MKLKRFFYRILERAGLIMPVKEVSKRANFFLNEAINHVRGGQAGLARLALEDALAHIKILARRS